jgi:Glycosyl transferase family 2
VALNFHNWEDSRVVEIGRLSILFRQRKAVVCELYPDSEIDPGLRQAVAGAPYEALVDTVMALLADAPRRAGLERAGLPLLAGLPQTAVLGPALTRFLQWRSQQTMPAAAGHAGCVTVSLCVHRVDDAVAATLAALARQTDQPIELLILADEACGARLQPLLAAAAIADARVIRLPSGCDAAAARNLALHHARGDSIVFSAPGDLHAPGGLRRLADFLAAHAEIDGVGSWLAPAIAGGEPLRFAELDHEIKADLLGPCPLPLRSCLLRRRFLDDSGVRHDAEFVAHGDLHFLVKCAVAGARFAVIPQALCTLASDDDGDDDEARRSADPAQQARFAIRARAPLIASVFPQLTQEQSQLLGQLHAHLWPPDADFAQRLLATLAGACVHASAALGTERETLARVLRREALRLIQIFFNAGLADRGWLDAQFGNAEVALFLAPVSAQLPMRPSAVRLYPEG